MNTTLMIVVGVLAGAALVRGGLMGYPAARPEAPRLNAKEQAVLLAASDAMFPRGGVLPISGSEAGVLTYMDETMRTSSLKMRFLMRLMLRFVEHGPWLFCKARLTSQRPEERVETLRSWADSRLYFLRVVFTSLRTLLSLAYLSNLRVVDQIGAVPNTAPFEPAPASAREGFGAPPSFDDAVAL